MSCGCQQQSSNIPQSTSVSCLNCHGNSCGQSARHPNHAQQFPNNLQHQQHQEPKPHEVSMFGVACKCPPPPNVKEPDPEPRCCPYLVCPCPEPCVIIDKPKCQDKKCCCCHLDCQKTPTGHNVTCKSCCKNCPVEIYCPVAKSCLPRCTPNCPQRFPHHPWCKIDTKNFQAL